MSLHELQQMAAATTRERFVEGSADPVELAYLGSLVLSNNVRTVGEIGFNAGLSSYHFLDTHPEVEVVSFDLGTHDYTPPAKEYIDEHFPGRHRLILGDSTETVPGYAADNQDTAFDLVFIDGGHTEEVARADIVNMRALSGPGTLVVMDDLVEWMHYGVGPTRAWRQAIAEGLIVQEELINGQGQKVDFVEPPGRRAWALGRYVF